MADRTTVKRLEKAALQTRIWLLELCHKGKIHIGGDMSCCDLMTLIWQHLMRYDTANPKWEERDRFVLSKGHAAAVTSFSQAAIGCYAVEDIFAEYATNFGRFGMHSCNLHNPYVDVSTGSLGHGFPVAGGVARQLKVKGLDSRVYCVLGDGECEEGSVWEAAMSSSKYKLDNLIAFVDRNRMSFDGCTEELMPLEPFADKWRAFGWNVIEVPDGNDMAQLLDAAASVQETAKGRPTVLICNTVKGKGVSFMENQKKWHTGVLSDEQLKQAKDELYSAYQKKWGEAV
ncbi:transketolase [Agathobaculum sp. TL06]